MILYIKNFLHHATLPQKFSCIIASFIVCIAALLYLYVNENRKLIVSTQSEIKGLAYNRAVTDLMINVFDHDNVLLDASLKEKWKKHFQQIENIALDPQYQAIKVSWDEIKEKINNFILDRIDPALHEKIKDEIISALFEIQSSIGNISGLILDPEAVTYHLAVVQTHYIPDAIHSIKLLLSDINNKKDNFSEYIIKNALLQDHIAMLKDTVNTAIKYQPSISSLKDKISNVSNEFSKIDSYFLNLKHDNLKFDYYITEQLSDGCTLVYELFAAIDNVLDKELNARISNIITTVSTLLAIVITLISIALVIATLTFKSINKRLKYLINHFKFISLGNYNEKIEVLSQDEIGEAIFSLKEMQGQLKNNFDTINQQNEYNMRITQALSEASMSIIILDSAFNIIYHNKSMAKLFALFPNVTQLTNSPIYEYCKNIIATFNPAITKQYNKAITIEDRIFYASFNIIVGNKQEYLGCVAEWSDITEKVKAQEEINNIIVLSAEGDFSKRINITGAQDHIAKINNDINSLLDTCNTSLEEILKIMVALSHGDLTQKIQKNFKGIVEEVKVNANATVDILKRTVKEIQGVAKFIDQTAVELANGSTNLQKKTESQAASLAEAAASMREITVTVQQNSENATNAAQLVKEAKNSAESCDVLVAKMTVSMSEIQESSKKISDILSVVDGIAFQTNLLALNAAVEAARAGEHGKGFSVVASEVRTLAQRSSNAAKEIKKLISDSQIKVAEGRKIVDVSSAALRDIITAVKKVNESVENIAAAGKEQAIGIEQVNETITHMNSTTEENSVLVEKTSNNIQIMNKQSQTLKKLVAFFHSDNDTSTTVK